MSTWNTVGKEDIGIDLERKEVDILCFTDNSGNIYITMTFDVIENIYNEIRPSMREATTASHDSQG